MKTTTKKILDSLWENFPNLKLCKPDIIAAWGFLYNCYKNQGKVLTCGNGGSACDAEHIIAELMNKFARRRRIPDALAARLKKTAGKEAGDLCERLQGALPGISLVSQVGVITAIANDIGADLVFAQQVCGYGHEGDVLIAISTSGNSPSVLSAIRVAKALGMKSIGLSGEDGGAMKGLSDTSILVPALSTPHIQELHQPIYHILCEMLEQEFFG